MTVLVWCLMFYCCCCLNMKLAVRLFCNVQVKTHLCDGLCDGLRDGLVPECCRVNEAAYLDVVNRPPRTTTFVPGEVQIAVPVPASPGRKWALD